ncbi:MAG: leucyl aminopeptidase [Sphingomonadales bacterium]|nr:leucyl aminopeptidase [Sphingomonadales bacterium]
MIKVEFAAARPDGAYALAIPVRAGDVLHDRLGALGEPVRALAARAAEAQRFERDLGGIAETFVEEEGIVRRLLLVGLGPQPGADGGYERAGGALTAKLLVSGETHLVVDLSGLGLAGGESARLAFGAAARSWRHDLYRTKLPRKQKPTLETMTLVGAAEDAEQEYARLAALLAGLDLTRNLVTEPANIVYPETFVERVRASLDGSGVEIETLDEKAMAKLGMGALLGVAQGSVRPPRLLVMRWNGGKAGAKPVVFVGKGITFDTGGISIKPAVEMDEMKFDMGGAASVLGTLRAVAELKPALNLVCLIPTCENMPGGRAVKPGDVVTSLSGQTVEILNTDAEGRLILCDALTYVERYEPAAVIDIATLTGACVIALGHVAAGLFANDDALAREVTTAADTAYDRVWHMPLWDDYQEQLKSNFADFANIGGRPAGAVTAACFLARFAGKFKWAHLDIAGTAWRSGKEKGSTGRPVPLLAQFLINRASRKG